MPDKPLSNYGKGYIHGYDAAVDRIQTFLDDYLQGEDRDSIIEKIKSELATTVLIELRDYLYLYRQNVVDHAQGVKDED